MYLKTVLRWISCLRPMKHRHSLLAILCGLLLMAGAAFGQESAFERLSPKAQPLSPEAAFDVRTEQQGKNLIVTMDIEKGYYLYSDRLSLTSDGIPVARLDATRTQTKQDPNFGQVEIWHDHARVVFGPVTGQVRLVWQGCEEAGLCYPPQSRNLTIDADGLVASLAQAGGRVWVILAFFGFGLALSLTPCVLPMVPIVAGMIGAQTSKTSPARGFGLAAIYVLAMALAFSLIGAVAAISGANLQIILQTPWAVGTMAALFVLLALSSFGVFELSLPQQITARIGKIAPKPGHPARAALLGFSSALIIGPCVTAPLAGALVYIAQSGDLVLGLAALFALGLGQGMPLLAVGLFGATILPRMGPWAIVVNRSMGVLFLALAIWLCARILSAPMILALWSALFVGLGGAMLGRARLGNALGAIALVIGCTQAVGAALGADDPLRPLGPLRASRTPEQPGHKEAFRPVASLADYHAALATGQPTLLYVTADWCTSCRSIDRHVLSDPLIKDALKDWQTLMLDISQINPERQTMMDALGVVGPPTMIFTQGGQNERLLGEISLRDMRTQLKTAHASQ